jgi:hypothetical protein
MKFMHKKTGPEKPSKFSPLRLLLIAFVIAILVVEGYCAFQVYSLSKEQKQYKKDVTEVNNISYGLLSADIWRDQIVSAATAKVETYRLSASQNAELKKEMEQVLKGLVDHAFTVIDSTPKTLGGKIKRLIVHTFVKKKKIEDQVPGYTQKIMSELTKPSSYKKLADMADTALAQMGKESYDSSVAVTKKSMDSIFSRYGTHDKVSFERRNADGIIRIQKQTYQYAFGMLGSILLILLVWRFIRNRRNLHIPVYILSVLSAVILLIVGLTSTMIEIDARIESMDFYLLGKNIIFNNQELFFQSKSILDVVILLIKTHKIDSQIVGVFILIFSVLFPFMKLSSTGIVLMSEQHWAKNKVVHYFAFKSGKWSMADVMVVGVLMTFIGFNGAVGRTLSDLDMGNSAVASITTNNTSIQPGYIIFIGFVLYGFVLSGILSKITRRFTKE